MSAPLLISLPPEATATLRRRAQAHGMSPATFAHLLLVQALRDPGAAAPAPDRAEARPAQPLLGPLRALLAVDLASAGSWDDLQERLAHHGYTFRERGGDLALYCLTTAARLCQASDLGWSHGELMRRFGVVFPGPAQDGLAHRALQNTTPGAHPSLFPELEDASDIILIEDD
ncbi:hypothetical protein [Gymnodinialimonas ulvae]|uniref:hypothetical protein n=1 Tax=Gymnodinialimonas ulvae TaxID=3126504 RepID=UPI0030A6365D